MNIEHLDKQDVILIDTVKRRISDIEKIQPCKLRRFLQVLDDFEIETRKYTR